MSSFNRSLSLLEAYFIQGLAIFGTLIKNPRPLEYIVEKKDENNPNALVVEYPEYEHYVQSVYVLNNMYRQKDLS